MLLLRVPYCGNQALLSGWHTVHRAAPREHLSACRHQSGYRPNASRLRRHSSCSRPLSSSTPILVEHDVSDGKRGRSVAYFVDPAGGRMQPVPWSGPWSARQSATASSVRPANGLLDRLVVPARALAKWIRSVYLPAGYPGSVKRGYGRYCSWLFVQSVVGSASYVLSTNALLSAVGVASGAPGNALSAAIAWTLKDGLGCLGVILYSSRFGSRFDVDTKRFRVRGDLAHNAGVGLELLTPLYPPLFVVVAAAANALKGVAGVVGGATRAAVNRSFAVRSNLGDVTARIHSISLTAYLVGMGLGIGAHRAAEATVFIGPQTAAWAWFTAFAAVHVGASYKTMRCVELNSLSVGRLTLVCHDWWTGGQKRGSKCMSPADANAAEAIVGPPTASTLLGSFPVVYGVPVAEMFEGATAETVSRAVDVFASEKFVVWPAADRVCVAVGVEAGPRDLLRAALCAIHVSLHLRTGASECTAANKDPGTRLSECQRALAATETEFTRFEEALISSGWAVEHVLIPMGHVRIS